MSTSKRKRRPLRKLIFLAVIAGVDVAIKNALEDKGGSYEAPAPAQAFSTPVPTPPVPVPPVRIVTAEDVVRRPVENLDEFADPVEPEPEHGPEHAGTGSHGDKDLDQDKGDAPTRVEPAIAGPADKAVDSDELKETPGKIDPFGIR